MKDFEKSYKELRPAQRQAVDTIEGPVLIIAGPGTGKTQLLAMRIANILQRTDTAAQNILCLTFTDAAAATMRERLTDLIGQEAYGITISTYHAFGSDLLRRFPEYFTDVAGARPVDELGISSILSELLDQSPHSNPLKFSQTASRDIKDLISDFKRALLTPNDIRAIAADNEKFIKSASGQVTKFLAGFKRVDAKSAQLFNRLADATSALQPSRKEAVPALSQLWQTELEAALDESQLTNKTTPLTTWKNNWLIKNAKGEFMADGKSTVQKLRAAADIYEQYLHTLGARGLFDYDDMILRAIKGLETHPELRYTLQEQYLYILLDEFQDTNEAQLRIVELLSDNPASEGKPNVMAVGDDDQAIFAFQGANYSHMLRFNDLYKDVKVITLTENFRSHKHILHVAHGVAEQIEERLHRRFAGISKVLTAENKNLPPKAIIERHEFKSDIAQFAWIAKEAKQLVGQGISLSDIALIAPRHKYLEPAVAFLHQADLPVRYEKRENVFDDPAVIQLERMSQLVIALGDSNNALADSLWPEVLSFPLWQLPTSQIWQLSWQASDKHANWVEIMLKSRQFKTIALFFIRLGLLVNTENLETILDYLIGVQPVELLEPDTPLYHSTFYDYYFGKKDGGADFWNLLSNLTVLRQHLREYKAEDEIPLSLNDFIGFAEAHRLANIKLLNTSPYHEAAEAIQLMTAYKAKGQEFAAVFVVACNDEAWGTKARSQANKITLPPNLRFVRYGGQTDDERLRLFYVAVTRAKHHLYLTNYAATFAGKATTSLKYLSETGQDPLISPLLPKPHDIAKQNEEEAPTLDNLVSYWQSGHHASRQQASLRALLAPRLDKFQLSPTHLNSFTDVIYGGPEYFFMNTILRFPKAPSSDGQYGNAIHETLEWIHLFNRRAGKLPTLKATLQYFEKRLVRKCLSQHHMALQLERGRIALKAYIKQRSHNVNAADECEFNFKNEGIVCGSANLSGKIDKLVIDKKAKTITIVDYKTGKSSPRWTNSEARLHKYRQQLYLYKFLVENSRTFAGYKVTSAYLEFVEPNEEGDITELHLEFDEPYMERVKQLVESVWNHVHALDFPAIDSYPATAKGIVMFEDDLLAGKI